MVASKTPAGQQGMVGREFMPSLAWPVGKSYYEMQGQIGAAKAAAEGQIGAAKAAAAGQAAVGQGQATAGLGNAYSDAYGAYSSGLGGVAQARANERTNFYNANALAEQGRQNALAGIGAAGLGAYGSAANSALGAWAANQTAYNKALADMQAASQAAMSGYGASRNAALGQQATALGGMASALGNASRTEQGNVNMPSVSGGGYGAGGFTATGYDDSAVADGSYTGMAGSGALGGMVGSRSSGPGPQFGSIAAGGFGGMDGVLGGIMDPGVMNRLDAGAASGMQQLDNQHYTSRGMPSQMLGQTLGGLAGLTGMNIGAVQGGMDQYYATANDPRNRARFGDVLQGLGSGFNTATGGINTLSRSIPGVLTPLQQAQESDAAAQFTKQAMARDAQPPSPAAPLPIARPAQRPMPAPYESSEARLQREKAAFLERAKLENQYHNALGYSSVKMKDAMRAAEQAWNLRQLEQRLRDAKGLGPNANVNPMVAGSFAGLGGLTVSGKPINPFIQPPGTFR